MALKGHLPKNFYPHHPDKGCALARTLAGQVVKCINCKLRPDCYYMLSRSGMWKLNETIRIKGVKKARTAYSSFF